MTDIRVKQWLLLGTMIVALIALCVLVAWISQDENAPARNGEPPVTTLNMNDKSLGAEHFVTEYGREMQSVQEEVKRLQTQLKAHQDEVARRQQKLSNAGDATLANESERALAVMGAMGALGTIGTNAQGLSPEPYDPKAARQANAQSVPPKRLTIKSVTSMKATEKPRSDATLAQNRTPQTRGEDLLITGSFARATLLNGVDAPTGGQANGNPVPMLMELTDTAVLPNRYRSDIERCFVTANATGDLSSERVLVRLDRLSCLTQEGLAIDVKLTGYVAGEDGKTGIKARVVTRSGQAIANALLVGTLSGLGKAVSLSAQEATTSITGTVTESVNNPWRAGLGEGMEDALSRVADYYLKLADKIFPVLEVDAGREVEIIVTQSASIKTDQPLF